MPRVLSKVGCDGVKAFAPQFDFIAVSKEFHM